MIDYQGNQDFTPIDRSPSESCTLHLPQIAEPVSVQKFLDRLMQYQVDPALLGRQIYQILATNIDREILLLQIANTLGVACGADFCLVAAVADQKVVIPNACWLQRSDRPNAADANQTPEYSQSTKLASPSISLEHPVFANVLADGEIVAISDYLEISAASSPNSPVTPLPCPAILAAPARFGGAVNGTIVLGKSQPHEWSAADRQRLEAASDAIGIAIAHIQKTQEIASLNQQLQRQAKYKNLLVRVAAAIDTSSEVDQILQRVIETTADTLEVDRGQILLLKYTDPLFKTRSANQTPQAKVELVCESSQKKDLNKPAIEPSNAGKKNSTAKTKTKEKTANSKSKTPNSKSNNFPAFWMSESSLCQEAFNRAPQSLAIADARELLAQQPEPIRQILKLQDMSAVLLVPLVGTSGQGTVLGFLVLQHSSSRIWQLEELEVVELIAAQLSTAIIQTQTLKQVQTLVEDRTAQLKQSLDVQAILYEQSRKQVEQLQRLNQLKDEFLAAASDQLQHPLTKIKIVVELFRKWELLSPAQITLYLDILDQECTQEINLIKDLLKLKELDSQQTPMSRIRIDLKPLIQDLAKDFNKKWADQGLSLVVNLPKRSLWSETDFDSLNRILLELLTNAGNFSDDGTAVVLDVSEASDLIFLSVSNCGRGISDDDLPHIFDRFRRGTGVTDKSGIRGTGLGLALVKSLVQHLNGNIDVSSSPSENSETAEQWRTCFTLTLPQFAADVSNREE